MGGNAGSPGIVGNVGGGSLGRCGPSGGTEDSTRGGCGGGTFGPTTSSIAGANSITGAGGGKAACGGTAAGGDLFTPYTARAKLNDGCMPAKPFPMGPLKPCFGMPGGIGCAHLVMPLAAFFAPTELTLGLLSNLSFFVAGSPEPEDGSALRLPNGKGKSSKLGDAHLMSRSFCVVVLDCFMVLRLILSCPDLFLGRSSSNRVSPLLTALRSNESLVQPKSFHSPSLFLHCQRGDPFGFSLECTAFSRSEWYCAHCSGV